jgi:HEAT repeat protein
VVSDDDFRQQLKQKPIDELIQLALTAIDEENDSGWAAIWELRHRATREVFDVARALCENADPEKRVVGVNILAQFGVEPRPFWEEILDIFFKLIDTEQDTDVLNAVGVGLGHTSEPRKVNPLLRLKNHPDPDVRFGAAFGLMGEEDPLAIQALIELSADEDDDIRDWATFGLGQSEVDTPEIREALFRRAIDDDDSSNAPGEGLAGLAKRQDPRAFELTLKYLEAGDAGTLVFDAAELLADPRLYPVLVQLRDDPDYDDYERSCLEYAIAACKGESLL